MSRYLTKSRFKLALSCPTKLFYTSKAEYPDSNTENAFLEALAEGGYQVGALAQCYYPDGILVDEKGYDLPLQRTRELLKQENVIIFEGAFRYKNLFIRADIIEKRGNRINLIEVKAKSFSGRDSTDMLSKKGFLDTGWEEYVYDVAFQKYVITQAHPEFDVRAHLMLADKNAAATVNGLNQKFLLKPLENGRTAVVIAGDVSKEALGKEVLIRINVDDIIERVYDGTDKQIPDPVSFIDRIHQFADMYERDEKIITPIHKDCKLCEFRTTPGQETEGKLSGFKQCWSEQLDWQDDMFELPNILDIWDFRKKPELLEKGKYLMQDLTPDDIGNLAPGKDGILTRTERQWMQVKKAVEKDNEPYIDLEGLKSEFRQFRYPLHFIDFETSMVAVPFFKGRKPYEQIAFQYSHHIVYEDLTIEHKGQYLCKGKGVFPNFDFVRNLKSELENDNGSIFRYAAHENTVLNQIMVQLQEVDSDIVPDKKELIDFIQSISHSANHNGNRDMIDLLKLVKNYYYHPIMGGSNSIKAVLPAVLSSSEYIQTKYSKPIYGKTSQIKSLNFDDGWMWIQWDDKGNIISPYKLLPPIFDNLTDEEIEEFLMSNGISDGGAAMTAYAKMQFAEITDFERERIISGLLKYCELDTLAMVMIWEYFLNVIHKKIKQNDHSLQM